MTNAFERELKLAQFGAYCMISRNCSLGRLSTLLYVHDTLLSGGGGGPPTVFNLNSYALEKGGMDLKK